MDRDFTNQALKDKFNSFITKFKEFLLSFENTDKDDKPNKMLEWLFNWIKYLQHENDNVRYRTYKRGSIIYLNFGYNVGNEIGGVHYAIVIDNNDNPNSSLLTVIPMTSDKGKEKKNPYMIDIGSEIKMTIINQLEGMIDRLKESIDRSMSRYNKAPDDVDKRINSLFKIRAKLEKMKSGSIVKVNQIRTISKLRILHPKHSNDFLNNIVLSDSTLDKINDKIIKFYTKK